MDVGAETIRQPAARRPTTLILVGLTAFALLGAAAINRFPLIHPDSGTYLRVGMGVGWPVDRSGFYGLYMRPFLALGAGPAALWLWVAVQAAAIATILVTALRRLAPGAGAAASALVLAVTVLLTALPWQASQLMPDAFTAPMILALWLALRRPANADGQLLLWLAIVALGLTHITHLLLLPAVGLVLALVQAWRGRAWRLAASRLAALGLACAAIAGMQILFNTMQFGFTSVSPAGPVFLFARLNEDGHIQPWLDQHCGRDAPAELCAIRPKLPHDSQELLWGPNSGLYFPVSPELPRWTAQFAAANRGAILSRPGPVLASTLAGGVAQLGEFGALDDECPKMCADPASVLLLSFEQAGPDMVAALKGSRQLQGTLPHDAVRWLTSPPTALAMVALLPLLGLAWRRGDDEAAALIAGVIALIILNALLAGGLSDVHARYQSRVAWLAPFVVMAVALRWRSAARAA